MKRFVVSILLIVMIITVLSSCEQISSVLDFSSSVSLKVQNSISNYNNFSSKLDKSSNPWAEIKSLDKTSITLIIHASSKKDINFDYSYTLYETSSTHTQGRQVNKLGSGNNNHSAIKVQAAKKAEVTLDLSKTTTLSEGGYVLETCGMYVYFELIKG